MEKIKIEINDVFLDSIKIGPFTIHKDISSDMYWNGKWIVSWNKVVKDDEVINSVPGKFNTLQEAIIAVENTWCK
jgi:hypothetical protein